MANNVVKYGLLAAAAYLGYEWWKGQTPASATLPAGGGIVPANSPTITPTGAVVSGSPLPTPTNQVQPAPTSFQSRPTDVPHDLLSQLVQRAGSAAPQNFDGWAYYYNEGGSPISSGLMDGIIAQGGGDRSVMITASQFIQDLNAAKAAGFSGLDPYWAAVRRGYRT